MTRRPTNPPDQHQPTQEPVYWECPDCGFLSADPNFANANARCRHCGAAHSTAHTFPAERLRRVDERIRHYDADGESEIVVILVATFLESLMEDMLARIMAAEGGSVKLRAAVLDAQRSVGVRIGKLFPTLTGEQFEAAATEFGFREFPHRWRVLRAERNAFIHDAAFEGERESLGKQSAEEAISLLDDAYALFVRINNRFVAGEKHRRRDDPAR